MPYKLLTGFNLPDGKGGEVRKEAGEVIDDLEDAEMLIERGSIERVDSPVKQKNASPGPSKTQE
jgi:hypothetical protein